MLGKELLWLGAGAALVIVVLITIAILWKRRRTS